MRGEEASVCAGVGGRSSRSDNSLPAPVTIVRQTAALQCSAGPLALQRISLRRRSSHKRAIVLTWIVRVHFRLKSDSFSCFVWLGPGYGLDKKIAAADQRRPHTTRALNHEHAIVADFMPSLAVTWPHTSPEESRISRTWTRRDSPASSQHVDTLSLPNDRGGSPCKLTWGCSGLFWPFFFLLFSFFFFFYLFFEIPWSSLIFHIMRACRARALAPSRLW